MFYAVSVLLAILTVRGIYCGIQNKSRQDVFLSLLPLPFFFGFFLSVVSGGTALNSAQTDYECYQSGHCYLESHGEWTEVSPERYWVVLICEILGYLSLVAGTVIGIIRYIKRRLAPTRLADPIHYI